MNDTDRSYWKYGFGVAMLVLGALLTYFKIGKEFLGITTVGYFLFYIGVVSIFIVTLQIVRKDKKIVDERMEFISAKASRIAFMALLLFAFVITIIDAIQSINIPGTYLMTYLICGIVLVYLVSYKLLIKVS